MHLTFGSLGGISVLSFLWLESMPWTMIYYLSLYTHNSDCPFDCQLFNTEFFNTVAQQFSVEQLILLSHTAQNNQAPKPGSCKLRKRHKEEIRVYLGKL